MKKSSWRWIKIWGIVTVLGLLAVIVATVTVDPFFHYHKPLQGFPYIVDNQLSQNPGMAEHFEYDSVILGSSMTVNFETDWFSELYDQKAVKLNYNGAYPRDQFRIMDIVFKNKMDVKCVYLGIDPVAYSADLYDTKYPLPEYLYDDNLINDIQYVLNKDVFLNYIIKPMVSPSLKTDLSKVYKLWWTDEYFNLENVLNDYTEPVPIAEPFDKEAFTDRTMENMQGNILPFIETHPETEFVVFFPPYSILFWNNMMVENRLDATIRQYEVITESLLQYKNVRVYLFSDLEDVICDFSNYADYTHYHTRINRYMAECFGKDDCRIKSLKDLQIRFQEFKEWLLKYDFNAILHK